MSDILALPRPKTHRPVRALVASRGPIAEIIEVRGPLLAYDTVEYGLSLLELGIPLPPRGGLWVWSGDYVWNPPGFEETHGEWELDAAAGSYRRLTPNEYARLARNQPLWHVAWPKAPEGPKTRGVHAPTPAHATP